jgi:hypothetical protein
MKKVADDAIVLSAGTSGLALADVPDSWSFSFYSPAKKRVYSVAVDHGTAQEPRDLGEAKSGVSVTPVVDVDSLTVGPATAVVNARKFGEKSGTVPKNVMVMGAFADTPGASALGVKPGVWSITFASGTDLADATEFKVDMKTGEVIADKK